MRRERGHSYEIIVGVRGPLMPGIGWVQDYAELTCYVEPIIKMLDHKNINEATGLQMTTAENLAIWLAQSLRVGLRWLSRVEVRETPTSNVILLLNDGEFIE